jgi:hypothetical protein
MSAQDDTAVVDEPTVVVLDSQPADAAAVDQTKETTESEQTAEQQENQERDESGKFKSKNATQARIDELTRQRHDAAREAAYWRGVAEAAKPKAETPAVTDAEPKETDFEQYGDYVRALAKHEARQLVMAEREQMAKQSQAEKVATGWQQRAEAFKATRPDFDTVVGESTIPIANHVLESVKDSEHGPALAYHLAQNPDIAARLNSLPPRAADREIGRIEATLDKPAAPQKRITSAPQPAGTTIGAGRSTEGDPSRMSMDDYMRWRTTKLKAE